MVLKYIISINSLTRYCTLKYRLRESSEVVERDVLIVLLIKKIKTSKNRVYPFWWITLYTYGLNGKSNGVYSSRRNMSTRKTVNNQFFKLEYHRIYIFVHIRNIFLIFNRNTKSDYIAVHAEYSSLKRLKKSHRHHTFLVNV